MKKLKLPLLIGLLGMLVTGSVNMALGSQRQSIAVRVIDNELFVEEASGKLRQLTRDGEYKGHPVLSPNDSKIIYHGKFDPYEISLAKPLLFNVLDVRTGKILAKIPINWLARYISRVDWLDQRYVSVEGEGAFLTILDIVSGGCPTDS